MPEKNVTQYMPYILLDEMSETMTKMSRWGSLEVKYFFRVMMIRILNSKKGT